MNHSTAGEQLKKLIHSKWPPLSQAEFARRMHMDRTRLAHYLAGRRVPPEEFWLAAAMQLGVDVEDITSSEVVAA